MQMNTIDAAELAELLVEAKKLAEFQVGSMHVLQLNYTGADIIVHVCPISGDASVTYADAQFDDESGGSIHDHARVA